MRAFNKITILGHLGRDPEVRFSAQGTAFCKFSLATTERRRGNGEEGELATWFNITVFGRQAELCGERLFKGSPVYVEGRFSCRPYVDRDGNNRISPEIAASDVQFLESRRDGDVPSTAGSRSTPTRSDSTASRNVADEDDIPF